MGDLHSIAYTRCSPSSVCWDQHGLEVPNIDMSFVMNNSSASFFTSLESDLSTGYLEDALADFKQRSKRRRFECLSDHATRYHDQNILSDVTGEYNCMRQVTFDEVSDEPRRTQRTILSGNENMDAEIKRPEEKFSASEALESSPSSSQHSENTMINSDISTALTGNILPAPEEGDTDERKKRVVYPFALVKPGGVAGDLTLSDINERILMPPTRPVRHPVGNFACRPCVSADGPGLSGKAVVALTRIQTHGRGTVTIIRTKG